jgi:hypothetical protein
MLGQVRRHYHQCTKTAEARFNWLDQCRRCKQYCVPVPAIIESYELAILTTENEHEKTSPILTEHSHLGDTSPNLPG